MRPDPPRNADRPGPTVRWGVGVGILIALVDSISLAISRDLPGEDAAQYVALADQVVNVLLFSLLGVRVGRQTGIPRAAAEAGVLAGAIAGVAAVLVGLLLPDPVAPIQTTREIVGILALNVAMGGILALLNGWLASRPSSGPRSR